ncbi:MAG TPA: family 78 glycoside hydrolase catalytic domain [Puia sp.]|nr:family 78 glycoside hydrolase catalytic domain [Puia sp.]
MKRSLSLVIAVILLFQFGFSQVSIRNLRCEGRINPLGVDVLNPRFSWQLVSDQRILEQTGYEIRVGLKSGKGDQLGSWKVMNSQSIFVSYTGKPLESGTAYYWQVRVWDNKGGVSGWSEKAYWQMGLLQASDWKAKWIESMSDADTVNGPALLFRKEFISQKKIISATVFITTHGMYEAYINGQKLGDAFLTPGWTSYNKRLQYQVYDVTKFVKTGKNAMGVDVGSGWYRTSLAWNNNKNVYGKKIGVLEQLEIIYVDGNREIIISDGNWKTSDQGPIRSSEIYNGETYDARKEMTGWNDVGYNDQSWQKVIEKEYPENNLIATYNESVTMHETFRPVRVFRTPKGEQVVDFGQNLVGWERLVVTGKPGDTITIDHAEVLDKEGNFYTDNLRAAKSENIYILKDDEGAFWPHFTFHGFRYIRIKGFKGEIRIDSIDRKQRDVIDFGTGPKTNNIYIDAVTLYSDMEKTGQFECSNPMLNQLQHNIQWGQKGNFLDVPTDCPQRDERLGWTGDAQAFSRTAGYNMGVHNFFSKWLKDLAADQSENGMVPFVIPNVLGPFAGGSTGWADASTIIPWNMWLVYGDPKILEDQYPSMKAWVGFMQTHSKDYLWNTGFHFGDWLFYRPADDNDGRSAVTDKYLIAQCFFAYSTQLLVNSAKILNKPEDVQKYSDLLQHIKEAFLKEYVTPSGRLVSGTQTAYVLALQFDMLPENLRAQAAQRLAQNIKDYDNHLTTGFLGTPYLCHVLSRFGYDSVAYQLLLQDTYPSWLYPVKMGATTIWERWDGQKPDSSFQTPGMNSFNHYAYGAIGDWMYRNITGIDNYGEAAGYKKISIRPHPGGNLTYANADLETGYGKLSAHWKTTEGKFIMDAEIPANTKAVIYIPASAAESITESGKQLSELKEITINGKEGNYVVLQTGSGIYHFVSTSMTVPR